MEAVLPQSAGSAATNPDLAKAAACAVLAPDTGKSVEKGIECDASYEGACSTTHLAEWKRFMRKVNSGNEKKFPTELVTKFNEDRTKLFQDWLKLGSFAKVTLYYRRTITACSS